MSYWIIELAVARRHKGIKRNIWGMTCKLGNGQPVRGMTCPTKPKREQGNGGWGIDTDCLGHLGIQPTVIQVLSGYNWRMTHRDCALYWGIQSDTLCKLLFMLSIGNIWCCPVRTITLTMHGISDLTGSFTQKLKFYHHLLSRMSFQTHLTCKEEYCEKCLISRIQWGPMFFIISSFMREKRKSYRWTIPLMFFPFNNNLFFFSLGYNELQ